MEATEFVDPLSALSSAPAASDPLSTLTDPLSSTNATSFDPLSNPLSNPLSESYVKKRSSSAIKVIVLLTFVLWFTWKYYFKLYWNFEFKMKNEVRLVLWIILCKKK